MKRLSLLLLTILPLIAFGQGIWQPQVTNNKINRVKIDSVLIVPRDTAATNNALYLGAPVGDSGRIAYYHNQFWGYTNAGWGTFVGAADLPIDTVLNITALLAYTGNAKLLIVTDSLRGGLFRKVNSVANNNGTKFPGWWRVYDEAIGINVCWFGAIGDGVNDDTQPIKDAVAAADNGDNIIFPTRSIYPSAGPFYKITSTITINKTALTLKGDNFNQQFSTTIKGTGSNYPMFIVTVAEVGFQGLTLRGNGSFTLIDPSTGAGRWADGATISGIRVEGDAGANGDLKVQNCTMIYLDTCITFKARNADIINNIFTQDKQPIVILDANTGQQRGFKIQGNWVHSNGDTCINRAFVKCVDQNAFQIWVNNNQLDGQPNGMLADITADSAVQVIGNNIAIGRGGLVKLTGVNGAQVNSNYYLGGSYLTRGDGVLLTNCKNITINGNNILQVANNGISLINTTNSIITGNYIKDFSWTGKGNAGNYNGISLDATSESNSIYSNQIAVRTAGYVFNRMILPSTTLAANHIGLNDKYLGANFSTTTGMEFASTVKTPVVGFGSFDTTLRYDISYVPANQELQVNRTGSFTNMRFQSNGNTRTDFLFDNSLGTMRIGVGNSNGYLTGASNAGGIEGAYLQYAKSGSATNSLTFSAASAMPLQRLGITADSVVIGNASVGSTSVAVINGFKIWNAGNDGAGSGLIADSLDGYNSTDFALSASTHTMAAGAGMSISGGTQDLSTNRTWTFTNTGILNQTLSEETKSFWAQFGNLRTLTLKGTTNPLVAFNDGTNPVANIQLTGGRLDFNNSNSYTSFTGTANIGFNIATPTAKVDINGATGYNQLRLRTSYTPTSTADANGNTGDVTWDASFIYIKTGAGWKRATLSTF